MDPISVDGEAVAGRFCSRLPRIFVHPNQEYRGMVPMGRGGLQNPIALNGSNVSVSMPHPHLPPESRIWGTHAFPKDHELISREERSWNDPQPARSC